MCLGRSIYNLLRSARKKGYSRIPRPLPPPHPTPRRASQLISGKWEQNRSTGLSFDYPPRICGIYYTYIDTVHKELHVQFWQPPVLVNWIIILLANEFHRCRETATATYNLSCQAPNLQVRRNYFCEITSYHFINSSLRSVKQHHCIVFYPW